MRSIAARSSQLAGPGGDVGPDREDGREVRGQPRQTAYHRRMVGIGGQRRCDLCGDPIPVSGGYGSGALADGLYCSLRCFALKDDRYIHRLEHQAAAEGSDEDEDE
jgi:hypothetical protein